MDERPLVGIAYGLWGVSAVSVATAWVAWRRRRNRLAENERLDSVDYRSKRSRKPWRVLHGWFRPDVYLATLGLLCAGLGAGAYFARPLQTGDSGYGRATEFYVSPDASPLVLPSQPVLTDTQQGGEATDAAPPSPDGRAEEAAPYVLGFDRLGPVELGSSPAEVEAAFGPPSSVRPERTPGGLELLAYVYVERERVFKAWFLGDQLTYYAVESGPFETISGIRIGDDIGQLQRVYGSRLVAGDGRQSSRATTPHRYYHLRSGDKVVRFLIDGERVVQIEGGLERG